MITYYLLNITCRIQIHKNTFLSENIVRTGSLRLRDRKQTQRHNSPSSQRRLKGLLTTAHCCQGFCASVPAIFRTLGPLVRLKVSQLFITNVSGGKHGQNSLWQIFTDQEKNGFFSNSSIFKFWVLHGIAWYCIILHYLALSCTILHYLALCCTIFSK